MVIQCAWCGEILGEKPPYDVRDVTHGMCELCLEEMIKEEGKSKDKRRKNKMKWIYG